MLLWLTSLGVNVGHSEEAKEVVLESSSNSQIEQVGELELQVQTLEEELVAKDDFLEHELEKIQHIRVVIDSRQSLSARQESLKILAETGSTMALPFLWEILGQTPSFDQDIIQALPKIVALDNSRDNITQVRDIVEKGLYLSEHQDSYYSLIGSTQHILETLNKNKVVRTDVAEIVIQTAITFSDPLILSVLYRYVEDTNVPTKLREQSLSGLQVNHAEWMSQQPALSLLAASDRVADNLYALSSGVAGSVLLGSVGVWGQSSSSESIGYLGGALVGGASGWLLAQDQKPTMAQSTLMASSIGWGLAQGQLLADGFDLNENYAALFRTIGVTAGTGYGHWARDRDMSLSDVLETDFSGYLGAQLAVALTDIVADQSIIQPPNYEGYATENSEEYDQAEINADIAQRKLQEKRLLAGSVGSLVGLGGAHLLMPAWDPTPESALFAGVWSGQMAIGSSLFLPAVNMTYPQGWVRLTAHASMAGALVYDHYNPVSLEQSIFSAYGASAGYLLGFGFNKLSNGEALDGSRNAALVSTMGAFAGTTLGNQLDFSPSDWVATGIGLYLAAGHFGTFSLVAEQNEWLTYSQTEGLMQAGMGSAALALIGAGVKYDISNADSIFLGSTFAWGAYYGALTPIALNMVDRLSDSERMLITLTAADAFMGLSAARLLQDRIHSEKTAIPQVMGVGGATLGAVGAALFTDSSQAISGAALLGATGGLVSGALLKRSEWDATAQLPSFTKPTWMPSMNVQVSPYTPESGGMGMYVGLMSQGF